MTEKSAYLDEVVVTGYQNVNRRELASAVSQIEMDEIKLSDKFSIDQMLAGQVAGMSVTRPVAARVPRRKSVFVEPLLYMGIRRLCGYSTGLFSTTTVSTGTRAVTSILWPKMPSTLSVMRLRGSIPMTSRVLPC